MTKDADDVQQEKESALITDKQMYVWQKTTTAVLKFIGNISAQMGSQEHKIEKEVGKRDGVLRLYGKKMEEDIRKDDER